MSFSGAKRIGSLISPIALRELGIPPDVARLSEIIAAWTDVVGGELAQHVRPIRYIGGKLILRAGSAVWVSKLRHSHDRVARELRRQPLFRELTGIEVRAAPTDRAGAKKKVTTARPLSADTRRLLQAVAADIDDPALRAALARLGRGNER